MIYHLSEGSQKLQGNNILRQMAEGEGFEPPVRSHARRFSRPVHSTTLPPLLKRCANHVIVRARTSKALALVQVV